MSNIEEMLRDAYKGAYDPEYEFDKMDGENYIKRLEGSANRLCVPIERALLCREFWEACGKTRGWDDFVFIVNANLFINGIMASELSIDDALAAIK